MGKKNPTVVSMGVEKGFQRFLGRLLEVKEGQVKTLALSQALGIPVFVLGVGEPTACLVSWASHSISSCRRRDQ